MFPEGKCNCAPDPPMDPIVAKAFMVMLFMDSMTRSTVEEFEQFKKKNQQKYLDEKLWFKTFEFFMEMSNDEFIKYKENYQRKVRESGKDGDQQSDPDRQKGSGEGNENFFHENSGSDF